MENSIYKLYNSCKLIKGDGIYFLYDLQRIKGYYISLKIGNYITNIDKNIKLNKADKRKIKELLDNEVIYNVKRFMPDTKILNIEPFYSSDLISNLILEYTDEFSSIEKSEILLEIIEKIRIKNIQIQINSAYREESLIDLITFLSTSVINHLELIFEKGKCNAAFLKKLSLNERIQLIIVIKKENQSILSNGKIMYVNEKLYLQGVHPIKFSIDKKLFDEAQVANTYFNRKIYINSNGNFYNAPEYKKSFINIFNNFSILKIKAIIKSKAFQKYWYVKKDICSVCKDCEFRYMCVDNRLPYKNKNGLWGFKIDCNYNPYTNTWKG